MKTEDDRLRPTDGRTRETPKGYAGSCRANYMCESGRFVRMNRPLCILISILTLGISSARAQDTFSIVAVDTVTGEVGSAGASCLDRTFGLGAAIISDVHPGLGAIHTQAQWDPINQQQAGDQMESGAAPQAILDYVTTNDDNGRPAIRQYGVVSLSQIPHAAAFTGDSCLDYKGHIVGSYYSIQGNILAGRNILEQMEANFLSAKGSLADRLMAALQGAKVRGADTRCYDSGTSSLSSFLRVAQKTDDPSELTLDIIIPQVKHAVEPIDSLQQRYDEWKASSSAVAFPSQGSIRVRSDGGKIFLTGLHDNTAGEFELWNSVGVLVWHSKVYDDVLQTPMTHGVYFYRLLSHTDAIIFGKILVQ